MEITQVLSSENVDEAESLLADKWGESIAPAKERATHFFEELKAVVKRRIDFDH